ncbi:unnamed protein product [Phytomonas sp. Hart1]|nr:unnamed protein product [Phytomonas sp. Hart1]|eukprot:CCW67980.1 unnamed protein product [Phytomonas sp. isolate Hart1]
MEDTMPSLNLRDKLLESLNPPADREAWCKGSHFNNYLRQLEQAEEMQAAEIVKRDLKLRILKKKRNSAMWNENKQDNLKGNQIQNLNTNKSMRSDVGRQVIEQAQYGQTFLAHEKPTPNLYISGKGRSDSTKKSKQQPQPTVGELLLNSYKMNHDNMPAFAFPPLLTPFKRSFFRYSDKKERPGASTLHEIDQMSRSSREVPPTRYTLNQKKNGYSFTERKIMDMSLQGQVNGPPGFFSSWATCAHRSY